jgi:hypothetical protein
VIARNRQPQIGPILPWGCSCPQLSLAPTRWGTFCNPNRPKIHALMRIMPTLAAPE